MRLGFEPFKMGVFVRLLLAWKDAIDMCIEVNDPQEMGEKRQVGQTVGDGGGCRLLYGRIKARDRLGAVRSRNRTTQF